MKSVLFYVLRNTDKRQTEKERTRKNSMFLRVFCGALEGTRTPDLLVRSQETVIFLPKHSQRQSGKS